MKTKLFLALLFVALAGCAPSTFKAARMLQEKYPGCEIVEIGEGFMGNPKFYVRTREGTVLRVRFSDQVKIVDEWTIFHAAPTNLRLEAAP